MESGKKLIVLSIMIGAIYYFSDVFNIDNIYKRIMIGIGLPFVLAVGNTIWIIIDELGSIEIERKMENKWGLYPLRKATLFEGETKIGKFAFMMMALVLNTFLLGTTAIIAMFVVLFVVGWIIDGTEWLWGIISHS